MIQSLQMELYFVTSNEGKVKEAESILAMPVKIARIELPEIQSLSLEEIVTEKVKAAYKEIGKPVFVDDAGFFVDAWNGFPGPFIKYLYQAGGNELLLRMMEQEEDRHISAKAVVGYYDGEDLQLFEGEVKGEVVSTPRGEGGWGFDPIFKPEHSELTFAQMGSDEKNKVSHRRMALEKFKVYLLSK